MGASRRAVRGAFAALVAWGLIGCDATQPGLRKAEQSLGKLGRVVEAKRYVMTVVILTRPEDDRVLNQTVWSVADEQVVDPALRNALEANGLRIGRITGELPRELEDLLREGPPNQPGVSTIVNPIGQSTLIDVTQSAPLPSVTVLLSQADGKVKGKPYELAKGFLRISIGYEGSGAVALRILPEIHHGPVQQNYSMVPGAGIAAPHEFQLKQAQKEDSFRDLLTTLVVEPGQVAVLGARSEPPGTLASLSLRRSRGIRTACSRACC